MSEDNLQDILLPPGTYLYNGKYVIEGRVGGGGFGIAYKALQTGLNREVCIKECFLAGKCMRNTRAKTVYSIENNGGIFEKYRQAFLEEAKILASLSHPNIVEVIDIFDENGTSYMVMPFIIGKSLESIVETQGKLSYPDAVNYIAQITDAVGYIHEQHFLHRDIKPANIMITPDYRAILIDFGIARKFEQDKMQRHTAQFTPGFAPFEQYSSDISQKGAYTDIYAIGATLYFILTGKIPMDAAARWAEKTQTMPEPKALSPDIPDEINRTILKAMQIKAENRHQSIGEFMDDLRNIRPSTLIDETSDRKSSKKSRWFIGAAVVVIVVLVAYLFLRVRVDGETDVTSEDFTGMHLYPMVKVEGGSFVMGDKTMDEDYEDCPPHRVTLSDFYIGQFEVSQGFWKKIMGKSHHSAASQPKEGAGKKLTQEQQNLFPVENVSFIEIQEFISRLNEQTGRHFALPTEAQWEYAARGGKQAKENTRYANGKPYPANIWFKKDKNKPFVIKLPEAVNELGIYQMSGNVAEWCLDYYDEEFYRNSNNSRNPYNSVLNESGNRVVRGGSYMDSSEDYVNVFFRDEKNEKSRPEATGFRLVINNL